MAASISSCLEGENVTSLTTATSQNSTTALRAGAHEKTMRAGTLDLGRLVGTLGCHDCFPAIVVKRVYSSALPFSEAMMNGKLRALIAMGSPGSI